MAVVSPSPSTPKIPRGRGSGLSHERHAEISVAAGPGDTAPTTGRRRDLLDAAVQVLAQTGLRGLTHRAVDAQAGVPQGSTSTYYRTRLALLSALTSHVAQELLAGIEVLGARVAALPEMADDELARACADEVVTALLALARRQDLVSAQSELVLEAARTPELLDILTPWRRALIDIVASIGSTVDPVKATDRAETTVAAFQGVLATSLWHPTQARAAYVERSSRQLLDLLQA
ncbi:MAG: TetR family transcriptional regulator [Phycicoccus sp.]|nr:TetR family transcriptional regulator [Phycicoccus sp.]